MELPRGEGIKGIDLSDRLTHAAEQPSRRTSRVVRLFIISLGEKKCEYNRSFSYFFSRLLSFFPWFDFACARGDDEGGFLPFLPSLFFFSLLSLPSFSLSPLSSSLLTLLSYRDTNDLFFFPRIMKVELLSRVKRQTLSFSRRFKAKAYFK